jgi:hypothetical protein
MLRLPISFHPILRFHLAQHHGVAPNNINKTDPINKILDQTLLDAVGRQ